jgi:hypothetical protein
MKKNFFKKGFFTTLALTLAVSVPSVVSATGSGYINSPTAKLATWTSGSAYACYAAAKTATGSSTYTYFQNYQSLGTAFVADNNRHVFIDLMEDDGLFNANDQIKRYQGNFSGRTLSSISVPNVYITGDIEASGDNAAELYIDMYVERVSGDSTTDTVQSGLFQYNVGIN